jgi:hypothetical protein
MGGAPRYLAPQVLRDLKEKMAFVAGPRQVGKTTLAKSLSGAKAGYLSWDVSGDRERILRRGAEAEELLLAPRPPRPRWIPGAVLLRLGGRREALVARVPEPARPRGGRRPRARRRPRQPRAPRPAPPGRQEGAEALPLRLVSRPGRGGPLPEPRRLPSPEEGPPRAGRERARPRAALLPRHRRARGRLRRRRETGADPPRRGEEGRPGGRPGAPLPEGALPESRSLAALGHGIEGLRDAGRNSRRAGPGPPSRPRLKSPRSGASVDPGGTMQADHGGDPVSTGHLAIEEHAGHAVCPVKTTVNKSCQRQRTRSRGLINRGRGTGSQPGALRRPVERTRLGPKPAT